MLRPQRMVLVVVLLLLCVGFASQIRSGADTFAQTVDTAWVRRYNGPGNSDDYAHALAVDSSGYVYVTGHSTGIGTGLDYATIKYLPNGDTAWVRRYNGPGNGNDEPYAIAVDGAGNVYVTGYSIGSDTYYDYATIKYHVNGDTAWVRRYNGQGDSTDYAYAIAVDDSNNVYVTGHSWGSGSGLDYATIKYHPNGDTAWVRRYNGPGNANDFAYAIAIDDSGNVYVTGYGCQHTTYPNNRDYLTIKYYPDGDTAWVRRYNGPGDADDYAYAIAVDCSGNVCVTGYSYQLPTYPYNPDYATIKYYSDGDTAWVRRYNGPGNSGDYALGIAVDDSNNIYVQGDSEGSGTSLDYATIKYHVNGDTSWVRRYNGSADSIDYAGAITVDSSNNVYVAGWSLDSVTYFDYATIKYYPNGATAWVRIYNGPANGWDEVSAIAVDGSGNVYVTGQSWGSGSDYDYATIKYVQAVSYISISDSAFIPQVDTIVVGDSVRWTNNGVSPHTSTSDTKSLWDSGTLYPGESFTFQFDTPGSYSYHCEFHPSMTGTIMVQPSTDVKDETGDRERPSEFVLSQNYPNPFNPTTKIEFTLAKSGFVTLQIYDVLGRKVKTLVSEELSSGYKSVIWDGKNDAGDEVASGVYFYQLKVGDFSQPKKMLLLK
jgi:plastocyanin